MTQILCVDFDGVIHSYTTPWINATTIPDPPVPGAIEFLKEALNTFDVQIFSSRSSQPEGQIAMATWLSNEWVKVYPYDPRGWQQIKWPTEKPPALVTLDDRAVTFTGTWPSIEELRNFKPWNRK